MIDIYKHIPLDKKIFDNSMFWSSGHGQMKTIKNIILVALKNNPCYITIAKLYFNFGEDAIRESLRTANVTFSSEVLNDLEKDIALCREVEDEIKIDNMSQKNKNIKDIQHRRIQKKKQKDLYLFVYGSLKKHFYNGDYLIGSSFIGESETINKYNMVKTSTEPFPFLRENKKEGLNTIRGELYLISLDILKKIDKLEGYPTLYNRKIIEVLANGTFYKSITYFLKDESVLINKKIETISEWSSAHEYEIITKNLKERLKDIFKAKSNILKGDHNESEL